MPAHKVAKMAGMPGAIRSPADHCPHNEVLSESEMRQFLKEEQAEGMHPSLKGKRF